MLLFHWDSFELPFQNLSQLLLQTPIVFENAMSLQNSMTQTAMVDTQTLGFS